MERYGRKWPSEMTDADIELACYASRWPVHLGGLGEYGHFLNAIKLLIKPEVYTWHHWSEVRFKAWCNEGVEDGHKEFWAWIGPSSVAKSTDAAAAIVIDWMAAPHLTRSVVCSTTRDMLGQRIWSEVVRIYSSIEGAPGKLIGSKQKIVLDESDNAKAGIFGIAVDASSNEDEALANIQGAHMPRNRVVADEFEGMKQAHIVNKARINLSGSGEFKYGLLANPLDRYSELGKACEPVDGWDSVVVEKGSDKDLIYKSKRGMVYFFNGLNSPAIKDPKKYPFMLQKEKIEETRKEFGEDSLLFWSQRIGFFPPEGTDYYRPITMKDLRHYKCFDRAYWVRETTKVAGLDLAFTEFGDRCVLKVAEFGEAHINDDERCIMIQFIKEYILRIRASDPQPIIFQITDQVHNILKQERIRPSHFGMDVTALQRGYADVIEAKIGHGVFRADSARAATDKPVSLLDRTPANKLYANRKTELYMTFVNFCRAGQIRGLDQNTAKELSERRLASLEKPFSIEDKKTMKARVGYSPDRQDAASIVTALIREVIGITPGRGTKQFTPKVDKYRKQAYKYDYRDSYERVAD